MQNAQNLMSSFEFIAALMSIIVGLGVTNLLAGAGRAFYRRDENPLDEIHIVLTLATLLLLALQWWVTFKWNTEVNWSFDKFLVLVVSNETGQGIIPRSSRCVCSTSRKPRFMEISFIRFGTCRLSVNTRSL